LELVNETQNKKETKPTQNTDSDAVSKELYCVDEETAMRPENTAGAVRMFVEGAFGGKSEKSFVF
jgi:histidyl-tRNA synthetase